MSIPVARAPVAHPSLPHVGELVRSWAYAGTDGRDLRIDLLRGFAVFAMAVDHIGGPSPLTTLTGGNRFMVSAAEAFVVISGVMVGIVYARLGMTQSTLQLARRAVLRAWTLYAIAVWMAIAFAAGNALVAMPKGAAFDADPFRFVFQVVTLQRTYYLVDVMLLYTFLLLLTPVAVVELRNGRWWSVLAASAALWGGYQLSPGLMTIPWAIQDNPVFNLAAWQVLFFPAVVLGYHRAQVAGVARRLPAPPLAGGWLLPLAVIVATMIWFHSTDAAILDGHLGARGGARLLDRWFSKSTLPLPRLLAMVVVFGFAWTLVSSAWKPVSAIAGPLLMPLGQSALYAYCAHIVIAFLIELSIYRTGSAPASLGPWTAAALQLLMIGALWAATRRHVLQRAVVWAGDPPLRPRPPGRRGIARPMPSLLAVSGALCLSWLGLVAMSPPSTGATEAAAARRAAFNNPVSTVTAMRVISEPTPAPQSRDDRQPLDVQPAAPVVREGAFFSPALERTMPYAIYLPAEYFADASREFPVAYMLHGVGGGYLEWYTYGLTDAAKDLMDSGTVTPMIIVMPEGERSYWVTGLSRDGQDWSNYVAKDLVAHIDGTYRTIASPGARAIGGLSRGAFGALYLGLTRPEVFGAVVATSPSLPAAAGIEDEPVGEDEFAAFDPVALAATIEPRDAPRVSIDVGLEDDWRPGVLLLTSVLTERGVAHEYHEYAGGHLQEYWTEHMPDYLGFVSRQFASSAIPDAVRQP